LAKLAHDRGAWPARCGVDGTLVVLSKAGTQHQGVSAVFDVLAASAERDGTGVLVPAFAGNDRSGVTRALSPPRLLELRSRHATNQPPFRAVMWYSLLRPASSRTRASLHERGEIDPTPGRARDREIAGG